MNNKDRYKEFCSHEPELSIFYQPWWLDSVCIEGSWDVLIFEKNDQILGVYPFYKKKKYGIFHLITMPPFTPFLGPFLKYPENLKNFEKVSLEKEIYDSFINELPEFDFLIQCFNYNFTNWLPFLWHQYKQTTYYSYVIENIADIEKVKSNFHYSKLKQIKKASKTVDVKYDLSPEDFYCFHKKTLEIQNKEISYKSDFFKNIAEAALSNNSGKIIYACDNERIYSALFFVWDKNSGYNLISANDPDLKRSGALSLLVTKAIAFLSDKTKAYDMEGSIIEKYEFSFRHYGGRQQPYFQIKKANSFLIKLMEFIIPGNN
jgi:hypothetical protein